MWLIGEGLDASEQFKAQKGTQFIPYSQFPPRMARKDTCTYSLTPAMAVPKTLQNVHSCEVNEVPLNCNSAGTLMHDLIESTNLKTLQNWLPRRVMSAWRIAGMVHALEGWNEHECGDIVLDMEKVWSGALVHGFRPVAQV